MKFLILPLLGLGSAIVQAEHWPLDSIDAHLKIHGTAKTAVGAVGQCLVLDGHSVIELKDTSALNGADGFTFSVWFNPYAPQSGQQVIAGKNRYSLGERQWTLMVEPDGRVKAYVQQGGWTTISGKEPLKAGHWHLATLTVTSDQAALYLNGKPVGEVKLKKPLAATKAAITLGGIADGGSLTQPFHGALDEAQFVSRVLSSAEVAAGYQPVRATHEIPKPLLADTPLWDEGETLLKTAELPVLKDVRFSVIKRYEFAKDGYRFLHGVGLGFHKGRLYASFGHNKGGENTDTEEARVCHSDDKGRTWSPVTTIDAGAGPVGVSHGVFLSHQGTLWSFHGAYTGIMQGIHTRAYVLDETTQQWQSRGTIIEGGFWPMQEPLKMDDGNWIMSGISAGVYSEKGTSPAAVAISHGDDFTKWDLVVIPPAKGIRMWGESTVFISGRRVTNLSRYGGEARALIATSDDYGRTWTTMLPSNLPMATSKPIAGTLSTGQHYLVCTTTADSGKRRSPLTIAVSKPGQSVFSQVFVIRHALFPGGPGESHEKAALSYPYAIEHDGHLYVGYSNSGGGVGRVGKDRELWNNNSAEMAVIPIERLK